MRFIDKQKLLEWLNAQADNPKLTNDMAIILSVVYGKVMAGDFDAPVVYGKVMNDDFNASDGGDL